MNIDQSVVRAFTPTGKLRASINLGNPSEFTIRQLAEIVIDLTGSASKIIDRPLPQDDPKQRQPDISKARELLGWQPIVPLADGLVNQLAALAPAGRVARPAELAAAIVFLASDDASFVHGVTLAVDGGRVAT